MFIFRCVFFGDFRKIANSSKIKLMRTIPDKRYNDFLPCFEVFDIRITPTVDMGKFEAQIAEWCKDAGDGVTYEFYQVYKIIQWYDFVACGKAIQMPDCTLNIVLRSGFALP